MARTFLREDFSKEEIELIQAHEPQIRTALADLLNSVLDDDELPLSKSTDVEKVAEALANRAFSVKNSKIRKKFIEEATEILKMSKYAAICKDILAEIKSKNVESLQFFRDSFRLSSLGFSENTFNFLMDLYKLGLHFGGGNTIGKGELAFAVLLSDAKLASHTDNDSKVDLVIKGSNVTIEMKADGGRLDGSGIRPTRITMSAIFECLMEAIASEIERITGHNASAFTSIEYWAEKGFVQVARQLTEIQKDFVISFDSGNPFSRKSIQSFWFTVFHTNLETIIRLLNRTAIDDVNLNLNAENILTEMFRRMYLRIYQNVVVEAEELFIMNKCKELGRVVRNPGTDAVEEFIVLDTIIRGRIYMSNTKNGKSNHKGILVFTKAVANDIFGTVVDYTEGQDEQDWKRKSNRDLHITPGNDNVRASHAIRLI